MIRVLQVYPQINNAGTERVIFNLYENIDTEVVQFDFLVERPGELDDKIRNMGGVIHYINAENKADYYGQLVSFFRKHPEYKIVHTHTHGRMGIILKAAKKCGIPCRIAHSHNARNDLPIAAAFVKGLTSIPMELYATHFFACSLNAAKWLFPHKVKKCTVLYNGIRVEDYLYNENYRHSIRANLGIADDVFVMIHVGRFAEQKNHEFIVKILKSYVELISSDWKMLFIGEGPKESIIRHQVEEAGLSEHVMFLGGRHDVNQLYSAADFFLFPSLHEGLGIVVIEAQSSGLPCIVSDAVPPEADLGLKLITTLRLQEAPEKWAKTIVHNMQDTQKREKMENYVLNSNYNIKRIATQMQQFYMENGK